MNSLEEFIQLVGIATLETIAMVFVSTLLATLGGLLLAITLIVCEPDGLHPMPRLLRVLNAIINLGRSIPFIILMVAIIPFTRLIVGTSIGTVAAIVPMVIAAIPYVARLVESAFKEVPRGLVEAVIVMGASPRQIITHTYLREGLPAIIRAITVTTITLISYSAMAGAVGGGGLGDLAIRYGYQRFQTDIMLATVIILVVMVQLVQSIGDRIAQRYDHR